MDPTFRYYNVRSTLELEDGGHLFVIYMSVLTFRNHNVEPTFFKNYDTCRPLKMETTYFRNMGAHLVKNTTWKPPILGSIVCDPPLKIMIVGRFKDLYMRGHI